jgi:hypothetical protein
MLRRSTRIVVLLATLAALTACTTDPPGGPPEGEYPIAVEIAPEPGQTDFFWGDDLFVRFDDRPDSIAIGLLDPDGDAMSGLQTVSADGRSATFNPDQPLAPDAWHIMSVDYEPSAGPLEVEFRTDAYGLPLGDDAADLAGSVYLFELGDADFVEPAGMGAILREGLADAHVLLGFTEQSTTALEDQPGLHFLTAVSIEQGGTRVQDPCARTLAMTWGADAEPGTDDDAPAAWEDPRLRMGPRDLSFAIEELIAVVSEFLLEGTVHPDRTDIKGMTIGGVIDTRALDGLFDGEAAEGAFCETLEAATEVPCQDCPDGSGAYCMTARAEGAAATLLPDHPPLVAQTCVDVLDRFWEDGSCADGVPRWDEDGDGEYELCPSWRPPIEE